MAISRRDTGGSVGVGGAEDHEAIRNRRGVGPNGEAWHLTREEHDRVASGVVDWAAITGVPEAALDTAGIIQIAAEAEVLGGLDGTTAVSPAGLLAKLATLPATGLTQDAVDAVHGSMNPSALNTFATMKNLNDASAEVLNSSKQMTEACEASIGTMGDALLHKVDKEDGKGLSAEDYTAEEKKKLAGLDAALVLKADTSALAPLSDTMRSLSQTVLDKADARTVGSLSISVAFNESRISAIAASSHFDLTPTCKFSSKSCSYGRDYNAVFLSFLIEGASIEANGLREVATLPTGYRPIEKIYFTCMSRLNWRDYVSTYGCIDTDGRISIYNNTQKYTMTDAFGECSFLSPNTKIMVRPRG